MDNSTKLFRAVYKITDGSGRFYIGSSKDPKYRYRDHKKRKYRGLDYSTTKIEVICYTDNFEKLEESLIKKELDAGNKLCVNKSYGCFGPKGVVFNEERLKRCSKLLKDRWQDPEKRKPLLLGRANSHKLNRYKDMSKKSHELRWSKMPKYYAKRKKDGKVFGPYQGYMIASKELALHDQTISNCLRRNFNNLTYEFYYEGGS